MGLDFSHGYAHWGYSGFMNFRRMLAEQIGINLDDMKGFGGSTSFNNFKDDIIPLLDHSDCDGELSIEECKKISLRLRELVSKWNDDDRDKQKAIELAEGMEMAIENDEVFEFK
jgi:hypothetical protein